MQKRTLRVTCSELLRVEPWGTCTFMRTFKNETLMWNLAEPGSRCRAAPPNHPEALLEEPQALQAVRENFHATFMAAPCKPRLCPWDAAQVLAEVSNIVLQPLHTVWGGHALARTLPHLNFSCHIENIEVTILKPRVPSKRSHCTLCHLHQDAGKNLS